MVWLVPQWLNVDLLLQSWAEELLPSAARSLATQYGIRHPGAQPEHAPIRHTLTQSNTTGEQSGPAASQEYRLQIFLLTFLWPMAHIVMILTEFGVLY